MSEGEVVTVGAGHGGAQCAIALRQNGLAGTVSPNLAQLANAGVPLKELLPTG